MDGNFMWRTVCFLLPAVTRTQWLWAFWFAEGFYWGQAPWADGSVSLLKPL